MDENAITNYIATIASQASSNTFEDIIKTCDNTLSGQEHFFTKGLSQDLKDRFSPSRFVASNTKMLFAGENTRIVLDINDRPLDIYYIYDGIAYKILADGYFSDEQELVATQLFLEMCKISKPVSNFNFKAYYTLYKEYIDLRSNFVSNEDNLEPKICKFYIEYGFWNNMFFKPINGLYYIASNLDLIEEVRLDKTLALKQYFEKGMYEGKTITFNPYTYVASNIERLKDFILIDDIMVEEATKHYVLSGFLLNLKHDSFDHYLYLANNPYRIRKILKTKDKKINWDFFKLSQSTVAKDYIRYYGNSRKRIFDPSEFVKKYIRDKDVNFDNKLCLENAKIYFVRGYVLHKHVRAGLSSFRMFQRFLQNRLRDTVNQVPFNVARMIVNNKFY